MMCKQSFKGVIFTNHAISRMRERGIKQGDAWATFRRPDNSRYSKKKGAYVYYRTWKDKKIEVVATKNEKPPVRRTSGPAEEWVVISVWSKKLASKRKGSEIKHRSLISKIISKLLSHK